MVEAVRLGGLVLAFLAAMGCAHTASLYYPLAAGQRWEYQVSGRQGEQAFSGTSVSVNRERQTVVGRATTPQRSEMLGGALTRFLGEDAQGVFELAQQAGDDAAPIVPKASPNYVLKTPLRAGTQWSSTWQSAQPGGPFSFPITKTIAATGEVVQVPAGTFHSCVLLEIAGSAPLPDSGTGAVLRVEGREWYAPGVGYVKGSFRESVAGMPERNTEIHFALQSHSGG